MAKPELGVQIKTGQESKAGINMQKWEDDKSAACQKEEEKRKNRQKTLCPLAPRHKFQEIMVILNIGMYSSAPPPSKSPNSPSVSFL